MPDDVLSQAEVESLLSTIDAPAPAGASSPAAAPTNDQALGRLAAGRPTGIDLQATPYDFKRPERVGKEQMRALQSLHEGFGRNFGAALSGLLRTIVDVKLTSVDQLTYSEFVFSLEHPTCFNLLSAAPLDGKLILDMNPAILFPVIDRLLGGGKDTAPPGRRPLTEIELRLASRVTNLFMSELKRAWQNVVELDVQVERVESNPQLVQVVPPSEVVILVVFEITIGDIRGMISLCIPFNAIERVGSKLHANSWTSYGRSEHSADTTALVSRNLDRSRVGLVATLATTRITTQELLSLRVGDIITTDQDCGHPIDVTVEGHNKLRATLGAFKGRKAIKIEQPLARREAA